MLATRPNGSSTIKAYANLVCTLAGTGTLGLAHATSLAGWAGLGLIVLSLFMSVYTGIILITSLYLKTNKRRHSYQEIAKDSFGKVGYWISYSTSAIGLHGTALVYNILAAGILHSTIVDATGKDTMSIKWYIFFVAVFCWACFVFTRTLKETAFLSILGALATLFVVCIVVGMSADEMARQAAAGIIVQHEIITTNLPRAMATISFAYGGNVVYPHVEQSMREPKKWNRAIWLALVTCFILYFTIAAVGYAAYGQDTLSPILSNLPKGPLTTSANLLITAHVMLASPIMLTSLSMMIETSLSTRWVQFADDYQGHSFTYRAILRTAISASVCLISLVIPFFGDVMDLLGALTGSMFVFILPVMCYYKLGGYQGASLAHKAFAVMTLAVGIVAMVMGSIDAIRDIYRDVHSSQH
ncbi:hypothetical protein DFQ26_009171 [Actinomortierella ambigua]|nr:hypothetical protein DFQ26_009171 [Actinomortierella ambigua]